MKTAKLTTATTALLCLLATTTALAATTATTGDPLPPWSEGFLDIHHINTGRGESALIIMPDGTTMLVDAGDINIKRDDLIPTLPDATREPGEWIARYALRAIAPAPRRVIDYMLLSHFHSDHMGMPSATSKTAPAGGYKLTGITEVAQHIPFEKIIDRGWPAYDFPKPLKGKDTLNYRKFVEWQVANKHSLAERFKVGANDQIVLRHNPAKYPDFEIRNIAANGVVWTGAGADTKNHFPDPKDTEPGAIIENYCSIAFRLSYGPFAYFSGGDLSARGSETASPSELWMDTERPVALVAGPVDVMKANHHAYYDANKAPLLSALRPRVIIVDTWTRLHLCLNTLRLMQSQKTWPGPREIFVTNHPGDIHTRLAPRTRAEPKPPPPGHVVIRVAPGGAQYHVYVLEETDESGRVKSIHGPYPSRSR